MLFNSYAFLFLFLPATLFGFFFLGSFNRRSAVIFLGITSLIFYGVWDSTYVVLLCASIFCNYAIGCVLAGEMTFSRKKVFVWLAVIGNLALLAYFKYGEMIHETLRQIGVSEASSLKIALPLGISFFTFTQIAFLVDCYRGEVKDKSWSSYLLFVTFFPHLIAGPVLHHRDMMPQFERIWNFRLHWSNFSAGLVIFTIGMCKKLLIADNLAPFSSQLFDSSETPTFVTTWVFLLSYSMQLYFDFSGYSDMAVGLARLFGIRMPVNFASPYKARDISDFWRRWHISLSTFLRDYLYIALGGNKRGKYRRYANLFATMLLGGLWHGAAWSFVLWGCLHGTYLIIFHGWGHIREQFKWNALPSFIAWPLTFLCVIGAWTYFRSPSIEKANVIIQSSLGLNGIELPAKILGHLGWMGEIAKASGVRETLGGGAQLTSAVGYTAFACFIAFIFPNTQELTRKFRPLISMNALKTRSFVSAKIIARHNFVTAVTIGALLAMCILMLLNPSEFLYFQF